MAKTENLKQNIETSTSKGINVQVEFNYRFLDKTKYGNNPKKKFESMISTKITSCLNQFAPNTIVIVLVLPVSKIVIKSMVAILEFEDENCFWKSVNFLVDKHMRYKKDLLNFCDEIADLKFNKDSSIMVFYSCDDHYFATLLAS